VNDTTLSALEEQWHATSVPLQQVVPGAQPEALLAEKEAKVQRWQSLHGIMEQELLQQLLGDVNGECDLVRCTIVTDFKSLLTLAHHSSSPFQESVRCVKSEHIKHLQICSFGGCRLLDWSERYNSRCPVLPFAGKELLFWLYRKQPKLTFAVYSKMQIYVRFMVNG
jgi:hypothetical protein